MKINEAITILKRHNEWRRGADIPMTDVTILGEAIDCVVEQHEQAELSDEMIMRILNCIGYEEESWIDFVRKELEKRKESQKYDADYLQSKIDAHTKRMEKKGLTADQMLEECRGGYVLTWQDVRRIVNIADSYTEKQMRGFDSEEAYYAEVLKRHEEEE